MTVMFNLISSLPSLKHDLASLTLPPPLATESRTPTPQTQPSNVQSDQSADRQVVPRSRWQTVLFEAGGLGAAVSEESMKRLKYCLQWLQVCTLDMSTSYT